MFLASSMLQHFAYMSIKLVSTKTSESHPLCSWTCLPSLSSKPAHAWINWTKVNFLGLVPPCICWKSCITFSGCASFTYFVSFLFHAKMFNCTVPGAMAANTAATHGKFHQSSCQCASCVFWYLKVHILCICLDKANQPCTLQFPSIHAIIQTGNAALTTSISQRIFSQPHIYLPSPSDYYYPTSAQDLKRISAKV